MFYNKQIRIKNFQTVAILMILLLLNACKSTEVKDPFWEIAINNDITEINSFLYSQAQKGEIVDCVFSFDKEFYVKNKQFDAKVRADLNLPKSFNKELKIDYTLVPEFKSNNEQRFNQHFYNYFLKTMESSFGHTFGQDENFNEKHLYWDNGKGIRVAVTVILDINLYMVSINNSKKLI